VKIVAVIGSVRVEAVGEAQQDGKMGQVIRVRNVESNRIVSGRVEASGVVTAEY
jgi:flagella basal body P-ring formation protein FlgA